MIRKTVAVFVLACLALLGLSAAEGEGGKPSPKPAGHVIESLELHMVLATMKRAQSPRVVDGQLVLSYSGPCHAVAAAFAHEGFSSLHPYERNRQGVFVLAYPVPLKQRDPLEYRVIVDGVWAVDPLAPARRLDSEAGVELSQVPVPYLSDLHLGLYKIMEADGLTAHFLFRGASGESVTVCGDFDNWDPFMLPLSETAPGTYELELPLAPGTHFYYFFYRGETVTDPLNPAKAARSEGRAVSVLNVSGD